MIYFLNYDILYDMNANKFNKKNKNIKIYEISINKLIQFIIIF